MKLQLLQRLAWAMLALSLLTPVFADLSSSKTLTSNTSLNLDTGNTAAGAGGDILWNGTTITPQVNAKAFNLGTSVSLNSYDKAALEAFKPAATSSPITASTLVVGDVFAVFTNGGNSAAVLVTANSSSSITLQFNTFGATSGSTVPTVTGVLNNSSDIPAGFPNSGIAQGSLFKVLGSGLADPGNSSLSNSQAAGGLPLTLNGASVNVTVGGVTKQTALYYATPSQISGVLPSSTPTGSGTLTVSYKGSTSNTFNIQVVPAAPGITTYNGSGVAQHAVTATLVTYTDSARPGERIILWGTGFGATGNSDTTYDTSAQQTSVPYKIYIGGVLADVSYKGASVYPGVGVFSVTIPANVPAGCFVPVAAVASDTVVSNVVTLPIAATGGVCSDPQLGYNGNQISSLNGSGTVKNGFLIVSQSTFPGVGVTNAAAGIFTQTTGVSASGGGTVSVGGCVISQTPTNAPGVTSIGLNPGTIALTGPAVAPVTLNIVPGLPGFYTTSSVFIPPNGGAFVFSGSGGADVGPFTATVNFPTPAIVWTNQASAATVNRSQGLNVTWTGGAPGSYVSITGASVFGPASGGYTCIAPQSAGQFTVPAYVLLALPSGAGTTTVQNSTNFSQFTATGLNFGGALGSVSFTVNSTYN